MLKRKWGNIQNLKTQGAMLWSKAKFIEMGEKNSRHFLNLEKRNYNERYMQSLITSKGLNLTNPSKILEEQAKYYESLPCLKSLKAILKLISCNSMLKIKVF